MTAKTPAKKKTAQTSASKAAAKKPARKPASKKTSSQTGKAGAAKKSGSGSTRATAKPPVKAAPTRRRTTAKPAAKKRGAKKTPARKASFSTDQVNLGHVFSLRPRVSTAFRPEDFRTAKHRLREERYVSLEAAARAVVEQAHDLGRERPRFAARHP